MYRICWLVKQPSVDIVNVFFLYRALRRIFFILFLSTAKLLLKKISRCFFVLNQRVKCIGYNTVKFNKIKVIARMWIYAPIKYINKLLNTYYYTL